MELKGSSAGADPGVGKGRGTNRLSSDSTPAMKYLQNLVIPYVGDKWYRLGVQLLEVDQENKLQLIESNERDVDTCCYKMFRYWLQTHPNANWHHLIAALRSRGVELISLAADLEKKFSVLSPDMKSSDKEIDNGGINFEKYKDVSLAFSALTSKFQIELETSSCFQVVKSRCISRAKHREMKTAIEGTHNIHGLFQYLDGNSMFFNWINIKFLETIATAVTVASGNNKLERIVQDYKDAIYSRTLRQVWDDIPSYRQVKNKYYSKLKSVFCDKDPDNVTVKEVITQCAPQLIKNIALDIMEINEGSLTISWLISTDEVYQAFLSLLAVPQDSRQANFLQIGAWIVHHPHFFMLEQRKIHAMIPTPKLLIGYYHGLLMRDSDIDQLMDKMFSSGLLTDQDHNLISTGYSVYQRKSLMLDYARCMGTKQLLVFCDLVQELCPEIGSQLKIGLQSDASAKSGSHDGDINKPAIASHDQYLYISTTSVHIVFSHLVDQIRELLYQHDHEQFLKQCREMKASDVHCINMFSDDQMKIFNGFKNTSILLWSLSAYFTWSDYSTLRVLSSSSKDAIRLLDEFDSQLNCTELIASYPIPHLSSNMIPTDLTSTHTVLAIRCDQELYNCTLQYVYDMRSLMVEKCDITLHCLQLLAVRPNPTIIYWTIPKCVVELISSKVPVHSDYLYSSGILEVLVYPEPLLATSDDVRIGSLAFVVDSEDSTDEGWATLSEKHEVERIDLQKQLQKQVEDNEYYAQQIIQKDSEYTMLKLKFQESDSNIKALVKTRNQLRKNLNLTHDKVEGVIKRLQVACEDVRSGFQNMSLLETIGSDVSKGLQSDQGLAFLTKLDVLHHEIEDMEEILEQDRAGERKLWDSQLKDTSLKGLVTTSMATSSLLLKVSGIPVDIEQEDIEYYFSRKTCGGGEATVIKFEDDAEAIVSIKHLDSKAQHGLLTVLHKMAGEVVTVTRCEDIISYTDPTTESPPKCTVVVKGFIYSDEDDVIIDCLELYFSNSQYGGGEIADDGIEVMKGKACITFVDSKVAHRVVLNSPHTMMGQKLQVTLVEDEPSEQNILLKNVPPSVDFEYLELYLDNVTGLSASNGDYEVLEKSGGHYMVVFKSTSGTQIDDFITQISKRKFKRQLIEVEKMIPSTSLIISNIIEKKDEDYFRMYFSSPQHSGVSEIDDIEMLDDGRVIVHLLNQESVQAVLQMKHTRLGPKVAIQVYDRFSVTNNHESSHFEGVDHDLTDHTPATPVHRMVSHVMAHFLQQHQSSLCELVEQVHAQISFHINDTSEVGFIFLLPLKGSEQIRNWNINCEAKLDLFFKDLSYSSVLVYPQLLPKLQETVEDTKSNTSLCVVFTKDYTTLQIAGYSDDVNELLMKIKHIEAELIIKEESIPMEKEKISYINQTQIEQLRDNYPCISITVNIDDGVVIVTGKQKDIETFKQSLEKVKCFTSSVMISSEVVKYLSLSGDQNVINKLLQQEESTATTYFDQNSCALFVLACEKAVASELANRLERIVGADTIKIAIPLKISQDRQLLALCDEIKKTYTVDIVSLPSEIQIIGDHQQISTVKHKLLQYIRTEYYGKRGLLVSTGQWRFISEHLTPQWNKIAHKLETDPQYQDVMVQFPKVTDDDPVILLEGEESLIISLFQQIATLVNSICTNDSPMIIERPGLFQFLATSEAKFAIKGIEASIPACIECTIKPIVEPIVNDGKKTSEICKGTTKEGKRVTLVIGDIENFKVDVIVNAANTSLSHTSGVALAISKKGGPKIQKDSEKYIRLHGILQEGDAILRDEVGDLSCKKIVYAVGPAWKNGTHFEDQVLKNTCKESLNLGHKYESYAFPAISSGFPLDVCANTMIQAFCAWSEDFPHSTLHDIYIVIHDHVAAAFTDAMKKYLYVFHQFNVPATPSKTPASLFPLGGKKHKKKSPQSDAFSVDSVLTSASSFQWVPIEVYKGELLKKEAEVYVNTTSRDLTLTNGAVSKSILNAAGQTIQDECSQFISKNGKLQPGDIAVTGPGKICCKYIIHTAISQYEGVSSEKELEIIVLKCLQFCDQKEAFSIAFPPLGAGGLKFPSDVVARVMVTTVHNYYQANQSCIKSIKFVIFMDSTYKEFQSFLSQNVGSTFSPLTAPPGTLLPSSATVTSSYQPSLSSFTSPLSGVMSEVFKTGNITVKVECGDISDDDSDVIVNITFSDLQLTSIAVSKVISKKAGPSMQQDCQMYIKQYKQLEEGKVCITQATGQLQCKKVFHVVVPDVSKANALSLLVTTCLKEAECNKVVSIAFPAIGTGGLSFNPSDVAQDMCARIIEFALTRPVFLQEIKIVVYQRDMYQTFVQKFIDISTRKPGQAKPNLLVWCTNFAVNSYISGRRNVTNTSTSDMYSKSVSDNPSVYNPSMPLLTAQSTSGGIFSITPVQIRVYAESEDNVIKAEDYLLQIIDQNYESLPVVDPLIASLKLDQISRLTQKARDNHVSIEIETELSRIQVRGGKNDVQIVKTEIERILHEIDTEKLWTEAIATEASWMQKKVTWQYLVDDNLYEDYEAKINYQIEKAYQLYKQQKQSPTVTFTDGGIQCQIIFNSDPMQEKDITTGEVINVQRFDLEDKITKTEFPSTWGDDINNNLQTKIVLLDTHEIEYTEVKSGFEATVSGQTIVKIERIQNPTLYAQYAARKGLMDKITTLGTINERRLYSACGPDVVENIYHNGFNRSYSSRNAAPYGDGVYFTVNASYSANTIYSPPDSNGNRHVFLARVLTGEYTLGRSGLKTPPPMYPNKSSVILYDSVVNNMSSPDIFVVFYDAQCYPEYLITFK